MPCSICHLPGHTAPRCNDQRIDVFKQTIMQTITYNRRYYEHLSNLPGYAITDSHLYHEFTSIDDVDRCRNIILSKRERHLNYQKYNCIGNFRHKFHHKEVSLLKRTFELVVNELNILYPGKVAQFLNNNRDSNFTSLRLMSHFNDFYGRLCHNIYLDIVPSSYLDMTQYATVDDFLILNWSVRQYSQPLQDLAIEIIPEEDNRRRLFDRLSDEMNRRVNRRVQLQVNRRQRPRAADTSRSMSIKMIEAGTKMFNEDNCPICFEASTNPVSLSCKHSFCGSCMITLLTNKAQACPCCRDTITEVHVLQNVCPSVFNQLYCLVK